MSDNTNKKPLRDYLAEYRVALGGAVEQLKRAATVYAKAVAEYGDEAAIAFHKAYPGVSATTWEKMRLVGTDSAVPEIMLLTDRVGARIMRLPLAKQRAMIGGKTKLEIVTPRGNIVRKPFTALTRTEEDAAFKENGEKRTVAEMRAYYAEKTADHEVLKPYDVQGNVLVIHRACRIGKAELVQILEAMR